MAPERQRSVTARGERGETVDPKLLELLACPLTKGRLVYDADRKELVSPGARLAYPIRDGVPIMLASEARRIEDAVPGPAGEG